MATTDIDPCQGTLVLENAKFALNSDNKVVVRVSDDDAQVLLGQILTALGGSSNTSANIANETIVAANTEQSYALPSNTKSFILRNRSLNDLRLAFTVNGTSGTEYITIKRGAVFKDINFYSSQTIYFQSTGSGDVIEILTYV